MIAKSICVALAAEFSVRERERLETWLLNLAKGGVVGGTYNYSAITKTADLNALRQELIDAGWTVVVDTTAKTATIS